MDFFVKITGVGNDTVTLNGITETSTEYDYGCALYEALSPYVEARENVTAFVYREGDANPIHQIAVVPRKDSVFISDNVDCCFPLSFSFIADKERLPERYLIMVNADRNNNKFYRMVDLGNNEWGAYYGRIGESSNESRFSAHADKPYVYRHYMYGIKLQEKLAKGYEDVTGLHKSYAELKEQRTVQSGGYAPISDEAVRDLISRLLDYANRTIQENYTINVTDVTPQMIEKAREVIKELSDAAELSFPNDVVVEDFNSALLKLMHILPRRIDGTGIFGVQSMMARDEFDFAKIYDREAKLLDVMEGQMKVQEQKEASENQKTILDAFGLEIYPATDKQKEQVLSRLSDTLKPKLKAVYRVIHKDSKKRFDEFLKEHGRHMEIRQFWHGSRNENWISILQKSLLLDSGAATTGKMFGNGIYFAPNAYKSWGYTSAHGTRWAHGSSNSAFMALYACAYGTPHEVYDHSSESWYGLNYAVFKNRHPNCDCVHAKKDKGMLREDEIIFYREDQMTINYICEFEG